MGQLKKHRTLERRDKRLDKVVWGLVRLLCCGAAKAAVDNKPAPQPVEERLANHMGNKKRPLEVSYSASAETSACQSLLQVVSREPF